MLGRLARALGTFAGTYCAACELEYARLLKSDGPCHKKLQVNRSGFRFVRGLSGRLTAVVTPEPAKRFREAFGIKEEDIGKPGFYLVNRITGRSLMERPPGKPIGARIAAAFKRLLSLTR